MNYFETLPKEMQLSVKRIAVFLKADPSLILRFDVVKGAITIDLISTFDKELSSVLAKIYTAEHEVGTFILLACKEAREELEQKRKEAGENAAKNFIKTIPGIDFSEN